MKLYKIKKFSVLLLALSSLYSCQDVIEPEPESAINSNSFLRTQAEFDLALAGVYDGLQSAYSDANAFFGEFRADSFIPAPTSTNVQRTSFHNSTMEASDSKLRWRDFYLTIDRANRIIQSSKNVTSVNSNTIGQAYAIRSKVYFDMVRIWGDLPLFLEPISNSSQAIKPRTSATTIMNDVVLKDLQMAESLINQNASPFRFSKASLLAHKAEVYMWLKQEGVAEKAIEDLIKLGTHSLVKTPEDWQNLFLNQPANTVLPDAKGKTQSGSELIFSINYLDNDPTASQWWQAYIQGATITVINDVVEQKWESRFPTTQVGWEDLYPGIIPTLSSSSTVGGVTTVKPLYGDWRRFASRERGSFESGLGTVVVGVARLHKWTKNRTNLQANLDRTDVVMYRYADMILLLAEAKVKLDKSSEALTLLNELRIARQLPPVIEDQFGTTPTEQIDYILDERQFELMGEGKRWWDLVRNDRVFKVLNPLLASRAQQPITNLRILFPIFQNHIIDARGAYGQNIGW